MTNITTEGLNLNLLPTITAEMQVSREAAKTAKDGSPLSFISLDVQTLEPVAFPRNDGNEPRSSKQRFRIECNKDRAPEAFDELINAPLGSTIRFKARLFSRGGKVRDFNQNLACLEALEAQVLTVQKRVDEDPA